GLQLEHRCRELLARARDFRCRDPEPKLRVQLENSCTCVAGGHRALSSGAHGTLSPGGWKSTLDSNSPSFAGEAPPIPSVSSGERSHTCAWPFLARSSRWRTS